MSFCSCLPPYQISVTFSDQISNLISELSRSAGMEWLSLETSSFTRVSVLSIKWQKIKRQEFLDGQK